MQTQFIVAIFSGLFVISNSVMAEECGSRSGDSVYVMDCIAERYRAADKELNEIYSQALKSLSDEVKWTLKNGPGA
ncbi:MAG: lysozyme inhibitor LprI family protein [Candidatus Competibacteraceae bacterium]